MGFISYLFSRTPLLFLIQNYWRDEAYSDLLVKRSFNEITRLTAGDFSPPLYYYILKVWTAIAGHSEIAGRSLSTLCFVILLYIISIILRDIFKIPLRRRIIYVLLCAVNPFLIAYVFETRMYMMATLFVTWSFFALWKKKHGLYVCMMTCALYTHYFAVFAYIIQMFFVVSPFVHDLYFKKISAPRFIRSISYVLLPSLLLIPWVIWTLFQHSGAQQFWVLPPEGSQWAFIPVVLYTGYETVNAQYYHPDMLYTFLHWKINMYIYFICAFGVVSWINENGKNALKLKTIWSTYVVPIYTWAFGPPVVMYILSLYFQPVYLPRYFIFSIPALLFILILSFERIYVIFSDNVKWQKVRSHAWIMSLSILFLLTHFYTPLNLKYHSKHEVGPLFRQIASHMTSKDVIYVTSELDYHLAQYYLPEGTPIRIFHKTYEEFPQYVGKVLIPSSSVTQIYPTYPSRAFVVNYDNYEIHSVK